jgi:hypothetical protein
MKLIYKEVLKLYGKKLENINNNSSEFGKVFDVTSVTNKYIVLNNGIKIITSIFHDTKQQYYKLIN